MYVLCNLIMSSPLLKNEYNDIVVDILGSFHLSIHFEYIKHKTVKLKYVLPYDTMSGCIYDIPDYKAVKKMAA